MRLITQLLKVWGDGRTYENISGKAGRNLEEIFSMLTEPDTVRASLTPEFVKYIKDLWPYKEGDTVLAEHVPSVKRIWIEFNSKAEAPFAVFWNETSFDITIITRAKDTGRLEIQTYSKAEDLPEGYRDLGFNLVARLMFAKNNTPDEFLVVQKDPLKVPGATAINAPTFLTTYSLRNPRRNHDGSYSAEDSHGVRYHSVRGHFRSLADKQVFIRPHWRGDPTLGVVRRIIVGV